jgi:hypothetical protein
VTLAAQLTLVSGGAALAGEPVNLTLGAGAGAQSCEADTESAGTATCTIASVAQQPGAAPIEAVFAGDSRNAASVASAGVNVGAAPAAPIAMAPSPLLSPAPGPGRSVLSSKHSTPAAPLATVLGLPSAHQCLSKRALLVHVHAPAGQKLRSVTLALGSRLLRSVTFTKGKDNSKDNKIPSTLVNLRGLPKGTFTLKIVVKTASGKTYRASRTYHTCVAGHTHKGRSPAT